MRTVLGLSSPGCEELAPWKSTRVVCILNVSAQIVAGMSLLPCLNCYKHYMPHFVGWGITLCQDFWPLAQSKLLLGNGAFSPIHISKSSRVRVWGTIFVCTGNVHFFAGHSLSLPRISKAGWQTREDDPNSNPMTFSNAVKNQLQQSTVTVLTSKELNFYAALGSATSC